MLSTFETMIMETTGVFLPDDLREIAGLMRESEKHPEKLDKDQFQALAKDAHDAWQTIKALGA